MSVKAASAPARQASPGLRRALAGAAVLVLLGAMALDTKVVTIGSAGDVRNDVFSADDYGKSEFPKVKADV